MDLCFCSKKIINISRNENQKKKKKQEKNNGQEKICNKKKVKYCVWKYDLF